MEVIPAGKEDSGNTPLQRAATAESCWHPSSGDVKNTPPGALTASTHPSWGTDSIKSPLLGHWQHQIPSPGALPIVTKPCPAAFSPGADVVQAGLMSHIPSSTEKHEHIGVSVLL